MSSFAEAYVDGASRGNPGPAGAGVVLKIDGEVVRVKRFLGRATNNQAEYLSLITALENLRDRGCRHVRVYTDSLLLYNQLNRRYRVRDDELKKLYNRVLELSKGFEKFEVVFVGRDENREADRLANEAIDESNA